MFHVRTVLPRIAAAVALWAAFLFLTGEFRPGGAFSLYTALLVVFVLHQSWRGYRDAQRARQQRA